MKTLTTTQPPWLCVSLKLYPLQRSNLHLLGPGMGRHRTVCTEREQAVSPVALRPCLHHFEINERKESDPEVLTFSLLQTRTNFGDLGDPGCSKKLLQRGTSIRFAPCPWSFHVAPEQALEWVSTFKKPSIKDIHNTICATPSPNSIFRIPCLLLNLLPFPPPYCAKVISEESARIQRDHLGNFC